VKEGDDIRNTLVSIAKRRLGRATPSEATGRILAFNGNVSSWHDEQCTLAEYCAFVARDVLAHIELAAEARIKQPQTRTQADNYDDEDRDADEHTRNNTILKTTSRNHPIAYMKYLCARCITTMKHFAASCNSQLWKPAEIKPD
jgi:hypothetical protein